MSGTILIAYRGEPRFPACDQHPDAVRYQIGEWFCDAIDGEPTSQELAAYLHIPPVVSVQTFLDRLSDGEYQQLMTAMANTTNVTLTRFIDRARVLRYIDLEATLTQTIKTAMVNRGVLSQARADALFAL